MIPESTRCTVNMLTSGHHPKITLDGSLVGQNFLSNQVKELSIGKIFPLLTSLKSMGREV
jgi:hypothetical protein